MSVYSRFVTKIENIIENPIIGLIATVAIIMILYSFMQSAILKTNQYYTAKSEFIVKTAHTWFIMMIIILILNLIF
jgi:cell division protein FtsX